jgi:hypothetical protein
MCGVLLRIPKSSRRLVDEIKSDTSEVLCYDVNLIQLPQNRNQCLILVFCYHGTGYLISYLSGQFSQLVSDWVDQSVGWSNLVFYMEVRSTVTNQFTFILPFSSVMK